VVPSSSSTLFHIKTARFPFWSFFDDASRARINQLKAMKLFRADKEACVLQKGTLEQLLFLSSKEGKVFFLRDPLPPPPLCVCVCHGSASLHFSSSFVMVSLSHQTTSSALGIAEEDEPFIPQLWTLVFMAPAEFFFLLESL
jgi:hypothetical protein